MADQHLRSRLADALTGEAIKLPSLYGNRWLLLDENHREQIVAKLLSLPGIAIVELPDTGNIWFDDGWAKFEGLSVPPKSDELRRFAAALLAVAVQAQEEQQ